MDSSGTQSVPLRMTGKRKITGGASYAVLGMTGEKYQNGRERRKNHQCAFFLLLFGFGNDIMKGLSVFEGTGVENS